MEKQNDKLILDENIDGNTQSIEFSLSYKIIANLYCVISSVLFISSLKVLIHTAYLDYLNPPLEKDRFYCDSFYKEVGYANEGNWLFLFLGFIVWIAFTIPFFNKDFKQWRERHPYWKFFNVFCGILAFVSWYWLGLLFD
jgi:hypothetical protein